MIEIKQKIIKKFMLNPHFLEVKNPRQGELIYLVANENPLKKRKKPSFPHLFLGLIIWIGP